MHSVTCYSTVLDFVCMHSVRFTSPILGIPRPNLQPSRRDRLVLDPLLHHVLFGDGAVDEVHHRGMPRLDDGKRVDIHGDVLQERHRLPPRGVGLVMEIRFMVLRWMIVLLFFFSWADQPTGSGQPRNPSSAHVHDAALCSCLLSHDQPTNQILVALEI